MFEYKEWRKLLLDRELVYMSGDWECYCIGPLNHKIFNLKIKIKKNNSTNNLYQMIKSNANGT